MNMRGGHPDGKQFCRYWAVGSCLFEKTELERESTAGIIEAGAGEGAEVPGGTEAPGVGGAKAGVY